MKMPKNFAVSRAHRLIVAMTLVFALGASPLSAQTPTAESTVTQLKETVITDTRLPIASTPLQKVPANVTVITRNEIAASPSRSLPDLLRQKVGILPLDTVGFGQFSSLSLRGFGEKTGVLILVDGVRVNDAGSSDLPFLWNSIPLANIERIEIIRGGMSTTYGEGAAAGVINIITRGAAEKPLTVSARAAAGNLGYYTAHASAAGRQDKFEYYVSGDRQEWGGWRDFSAYRSWSAIVKPALDTAAGKFTFGYYYHSDISENPGNLTLTQYQTNPRQRGAFPVTFENDIHRFSLDYAKALDSGWTLQGKAHGQRFDTRSESAFGVSEIEQPNYGLTFQVGKDAELLGRKNLFTIGTELIQQDFKSTFTGGFITEADHWTTSVFAQDTLELTERVALTAGVRYDYREWDVLVVSPPSPTIDQDKHASVFSPKAGLTWQMTEKASSWLSVSRAFRLPAGFDIGAAGSLPGQLFYSNPSIDPVDARTAEIGWRGGDGRWLNGSVAYFHSEVRDDIIYNPFTFQNENFDSIRQGVELSLVSRPHEAADFYFNASWVDAQFDGGDFNGKRLPLVPEWQLTGGVNVRPLKGLQLTLETVYAGGQVATNDFTNSFGKNEFTVVNARVAYQWREFTVFAAVNNLFDKLYEAFPAVTSFSPQTRGYNPAPGINFQVGGSVKF